MRRSKASSSRTRDRVTTLFIPGTRLPHWVVTAPIVSFIVAALVTRAS